MGLEKSCYNSGKGAGLDEGSRRVATGWGKYPYEGIPRSEGINHTHKEQIDNFVPEPRQAPPSPVKEGVGLCLTGSRIAATLSSALIAMSHSLEPSLADTTKCRHTEVINRYKVLTLI